MTTTPDHPRPSLRRPGRKPLIVWDVVLTAILLTALAFVSFAVSVFGAFLVMASDPCGSTNCNNGLIAFGVLVAMGLPWIMLVATVVAAIILMAKRRIAFWVPLVGTPLVVGAWLLGAAIASGGGPG
ncbi:hypothetical protein [uncultured Microbacterium sp.]|uniref:hypothetical protein n=1 Tax=uncultured Microbacterium sp. TaxID=191216 RepID=UPI0035CBF0A3